jgi:hypothetical protein
MSDRYSIDAVDESLPPLFRATVSMSMDGATERSTNMTLKELADKLEVLDEDAFVSLLQLEYTHDGEPGQVKAMMIDALRFADAHEMKAARPPLDSAD